MSGCQKLSFPTKSEARKARDACLAARERGQDRRQEWRTYRCHHCGAYHLTSAPHWRFEETRTA